MKSVFDDQLQKYLWHPENIAERIDLMSKGYECVNHVMDYYDKVK